MWKLLLSASYIVFRIKCFELEDVFLPKMIPVLYNMFLYHFIDKSKSESPMTCTSTKQLRQTKEHKQRQTNNKQHTQHKEDKQKKTEKNKDTNKNKRALWMADKKACVRACKNVKKDSNLPRLFVS